MVVELCVGWVIGCRGAFSFGAKAFDGVCESCADGLVADGQQGDADREEADQKEDATGDVDPIVISLEPTVQAEPGDWGCDDQRDQHELDEVAGDEDGNAGDGGAEDFADTDLAGPAFGHIGGKAEEAEAGDKDG